MHMLPHYLVHEMSESIWHERFNHLEIVVEKVLSGYVSII